MNQWVTQLPKVVSVWQEDIDLPEPLGQFAARFSHMPGTVMLLSGADLDASQYHILGILPWLSIKAFGSKISVTSREKTWTLDTDPFACLQTLLDHCHLKDAQNFSPMAAGLMGYFAYDIKDLIEDLPQTCVSTGLPDICVYAPSMILVQNTISKNTTLFIPILENNASDVPPKVYINRLKQKFWEDVRQTDTDTRFCIDARGLVSGFEKSEYLAAVKKIIQYLKAGDIYQANLSQRFETGFSGNAYALFLALFQRNPAPFFSYVQAGDHQIVSTSPERFVRQRGNQVETRPIKGTIARGTTPQEDKKNGEMLRLSIKDDAELTMIVDLMRNDLSKVTTHGSVKVVEHKRLEPYDNVFHLVSVVQGTLCPSSTGMDLVKACFPGGSITGCPKIRAMEIIDELEPVKRHVYTGSIGYISFHDTMDLSIAIRTATIKENRIFFSVGGGIVYDSDPEKEFQETLDKGQTIMETLTRGAHGHCKKGPRAWVNGKMVYQDQAVVAADIPGFQYGAGVFETIRVEKGDPVRLGAHILRMYRSWQALFGTDPPIITWSRVVDLLVKENSLETVTAAVKIIMAKPGFLAAFARPYRHRLTMLGKTGLDLVTYPYPRHTPLAEHKTLNYLYYDQAGQYARDQGADEAVILNPDQTVSETSTCNILIIQGCQVIVPDSAHALPGVTLAAALSGLERQGYVTEHKPVHAHELAFFSNIFLTNALMGAVQVNHVDGKAIFHEKGLCETVNAGIVN
ncbi:MAG TPA: aminodeoxychorismate synthase component I [Desulfotignum sp.]|nr:aminodeoxychorismate synthase component I [Desulfotignum sp.]